MASILQVVPYYAPAWSYGGPPKVMWEEARALVALGHEVVVFTTDAYDSDRRTAPSDTEGDGPIQVHRFPNLSNWLAYHRYRFTPRGFLGSLRSARPDVIHLSEMRHELAIGAFLASKRHRIPLLVSAHGTLPRRSGWKASARRAYDAVFVKPMLSAATGLLAQTRHEADLYVAFGADPERVHLLPLGTDEPPSDDGREFRFGLPPEARIILFLGRIHVLKGIDRLIEAFVAASAAHPDAHLVVAGRDDGDLDRCRSISAASGVGTRIHFPGPIYGDDRFQAYRSADLFAITPTHFEETSLASLEAASVGTPLVVSAEADVPFLDEYGAGWRVPAGRPAGDVLERALSSDLSQAGAAATRMIAERHLWSVIGRQLDALIEGAVR